MKTAQPIKKGRQGFDEVDPNPDLLSTTPKFTENVLNIFPYHYAHIINTNTNITELVVGPKTARLTRNMRVVGKGYCRLKAQSK
jgi:hypothetical protein